MWKRPSLEPLVAHSPIAVARFICGRSRETGVPPGADEAPEDGVSLSRPDAGTPRDQTLKARSEAKDFEAAVVVKSGARLLVE